MPTPTSASPSSPNPTSPDSARQVYMKAFRERQKAAGHYRATATFSPEERKRVQDSATRHGEGFATHLKTLALAHLEERYLVPPDMLERMDELLAIVRGVGNNLNQLARYSNEMRYFLDTEEVRLQIKRLTESVQTFIREPSPVHPHGHPQP